MNEDELALAGRWSDACLAAALFAVDPQGLGGVSLRALHGPVRDAWLAQWRTLRAETETERRLPIHIEDDRLLGGLDLTATLQTGRPVAGRGLLAEADGGVIVAAMAERIAPETAARLAAVVDTGIVQLAREGLDERIATRFGLVLLDEGMSADERPPEALLDRLAFHLDLSDVPPAMAEFAEDVGGLRDEIDAARATLADVVVGDDALEALCGGAVAFGIASLRAPLLAMRAARASAALAGRTEVGPEDLSAAARLVLAPRATRMPAPQNEAEDDTPDEDNPDESSADENQHDDPPPQPEESESPDDEAEDSAEEPDPAQIDFANDDIVLEATEAAIPADLLAQLRMGPITRSSNTAGGRAGALRNAARGGRPIGARPGALRSGNRLHLIETLRAAAPWQAVRRAERPPTEEGRIDVRAEDFRIRRHKKRTETVTIFLVDASGSAALQRLAEAKGAVELLLADCYVRRDSVALITFRGEVADLILPPTRSLVRAKRALAGLPGGGGTPLATGIDAGLGLAEQIQREGRSPLIVLLTDGRGNIGRDGKPGREQARDDAQNAARALGVSGVASLLVDISPRPRPDSSELANLMQGGYLALPHADSRTLSAAIQVATPELAAV